MNTPSLAYDVLSVLCVWQETLVPQADPGDTEMVCTWQGKNFICLLSMTLSCSTALPALGGSLDAISSLSPAGGDDRLFNSPVQFTDLGKAEDEEEAPSKLPPYSRLT